MLELWLLIMNFYNKLSAQHCCLWFENSTWMARFQNKAFANKWPFQTFSCFSSEVGNLLSHVILIESIDLNFFSKSCITVLPWKEHVCRDMYELNTTLKQKITALQLDKGQIQVLLKWHEDVCNVWQDRFVLFYLELFEFQSSRFVYLLICNNFFLSS